MDFARRERNGNGDRGLIKHFLIISYRIGSLDPFVDRMTYFHFRIPDCSAGETQLVSPRSFSGVSAPGKFTIHELNA